MKKTADILQIIGGAILGFVAADGFELLILFLAAAFLVGGSALRAQAWTE